MPNCTEEIGTDKIDFGRVGRRVVEGCFDGGSMTSDGGVKRTKVDAFVLVKLFLLLPHAGAIEEKPFKTMT